MSEKRSAKDVSVVSGSTLNGDLMVVIENVNNNAGILADVLNRIEILEKYVTDLENYFGQYNSLQGGKYEIVESEDNGSKATKPRTKGEQKAYLDGYEMCAECLEDYLTDEGKQRLESLLMAVRSEVEIESLPFVNTERKVGYWIENAPEWQNVDPPYICSECGLMHLRKTNYCDQCGAKMINEDREDE